ncbi:MAG: PqqD family protein [Candidatus Promineifilaceae bacterium]
MNNILNLYPKPHPQTAGRVIDKEAVLILSDSSEVNVLNPVGSRIFELADGTHTIADIAEVIFLEYDVTAEQAQEDVTTFIKQLEKRQVFILSEERET